LNILVGKRVYLSQPLEFADDYSWRTEVKNRLKSEFGLKVFDPSDDPKQGVIEEIYKLRQAEDYDKLSKLAWSFVRKDLGICDRADMIIAYVPKDVKTTGVVHEIVNSNNAKKLTLLVEGTCKSKVPLWYFGFIDHNHIFGKWEELFKYLQEVNEGKHQDDPRLFFLNNYPFAWLV